MSDLLIKGMEMPYCCVVCPFKEMYHDGLVCKATTPHKYIPKFLHERYEKCPLVEIPTPHGELIDRDHLLSLIEGWNEDVENDKQNEFSFVVGKTLNGVIRIIRGAHAFIEAEEEQ